MSTTTAGSTQDGGAALFAGTACGEPVSYTLGGDERIMVVAERGQIGGVAVLDGEMFDPEDETSWQSYTASHDTMLVLAFDHPEPATPHTVTAIFDSFFAGRGTGVIGFVEHSDGEVVDIVSIDLANQTIEVEFTIPVWGRSSQYPPDFSDYDECRNGVIVGGFGGSFEVIGTVDPDVTMPPSPDALPVTTPPR